MSRRVEASRATGSITPVESASLTFSRPDGFASEMEDHRRELTGYCYRMLGAGSEAEDAVQETFLRAWRARDGFERRATLRSWLYKIATNVCLDMPQRPQRRARPMDLVADVDDRDRGAQRAARVPLGAADRRRPRPDDRRATRPSWRPSARRSAWRSWPRCRRSRPASARC